MSKPSLRDPSIAMPALVLLVGVPLLFWGERFPIGGGWGYDGQNYGKWVVDFDKWIWGRKMEAYYIGKTLPSAILHYSLRLLDIEPTKLNVIRAFQVFNLMVLTAAAFAWARIARRLALTETRAWFGFLALFVNFPFLKSGLYNPLSINPAGFCLGMLLFYAFLARNQILLVVICCLGAYTWPTLLPAGMILFVFPRRPAGDEPPPQQAAPTPAPLGLNVLIGLAAAGAALWLVDHYVFDASYGVFNKAYAKHISSSFLYLSVACALVFVTLAITRLLDARYLYRPSTYVTRSSLVGVAMRAVLALGLFWAARASYRYLGAAGPGPDLEFYYAQVVFGAVIRPLQFLVAHVVLFGPVVIIVVLRWRAICRAIQAMGPGPVLFVLTLLLQSISAQGRQLIPYMPFLVGVVATLWDDEVPLPVFGALCFLYSKIWFPINEVALRGDPRQWPLQRFFMNHGPWINATMYVAQGAVVVLTTMYFYFTLRHRPHARTAT